MRSLVVSLLLSRGLFAVYGLAIVTLNLNQRENRIKIIKLLYENDGSAKVTF